MSEIDDSDDYPPTFLSRSLSTIHTSQETEDTCWSHSIANLVSRYIRNLYDKDLLFSDVNPLDEVCEYLFYTVSCKNIFDCILEKKYCSNQKIINSALLFRLLYNILLKMTRFNMCSLFQLRCIKKIMKYLKTITRQDIIKILKIKSVEYVFFQENIDVIWELIQYNQTAFNPSYYSCTKGKTLDVGNLKKILNKGFYAFFFVMNRFKITGHATIISGYDSITDMYKIKNSWGNTNSFIMHNFNSRDNEAHSSMFYNAENKLLVDGIYYIVPPSINEKTRSSLSRRGGTRKLP